MATERNILLVKHAPIQTVSPHLPLSLYSWNVPMNTAEFCYVSSICSQPTSEIWKPERPPAKAAWPLLSDISC